MQPLTGGRRALVLGRGITALTCARLLAGQGWEVVLQGPPGGQYPPLVLRALTGALLLELWHAQPDLLAGAYALRGRQVDWGQADPVTVPQAGWVTRSELLQAQLQARLVRDCGTQVALRAEPLPADAVWEAARSLACSWIVDATGRAGLLAPLIPCQRRRYGARQVLAAEAVLTSAHPACILETVQDGWVFMAPLARDRALVLGMLPRAPQRATTWLTRLLERTRHIRPVLGGTLAPPVRYDAMPQALFPPCGPGWLAVGEAALSFDPLCGDGVGQALRGAALAASVLEGVQSGLDAAACLTHYRQVLALTLGRHLGECLAYYGEIASPIWQEELDAMRSGLRDLGPPPDADAIRFTLHGATLVPRAGQQVTASCPLPGE